MEKNGPVQPLVPPAPSFEFRLQRAPVGIVILDASLRIRSVNPVALRMLATADLNLIGENILALHPPESRGKIAWLIEQARTEAEGHASLVITTGMGSLIAKVSRLDLGVGGAVDGFCMMIYAFAQSLPESRDWPGESAQMRTVQALPMVGEAAMAALCPLMKLPLVRGKGGVISLVDVADVVFLEAQGHYAEARTLSFTAFCPRPLADLERRLDPSVFVRTHRRYLVNVRHVLAALREDGEWRLVMGDAARTRVPVSRAKVATMRRLLAV